MKWAQGESTNMWEEGRGKAQRIPEYHGLKFDGAVGVGMPCALVFGKK